MGAWFLGAKSENDSANIYAACDLMRCDPIECDDHAKDVVVAFLKGRSRWDDEINGVHAVEKIFIDGGGSVGMHEAKVSWEANGCGMATYVRHLPFALDTFRNLKPRKHLVGCVEFGGFCRSYVLSERTVRESIPVMERLARGTESLRQEAEIEIQKTFNMAPNTFSVRKCGCLSGLAYVECCGKSVEGPRHKDLRGDMTGGGGR